MENRRVWRITHRDYTGEAFSGEGARIFGGRFNSEGQPVVYTSGSLSLALLELWVQTNDREYFSSCVCLYADVPDHLILELPASCLPRGWDKVPYSSASQTIGDEWLSGKEFPVLKIPSVVVPVERNYILNPRHPDFGQIRYSQPEALPFDERLFSGPV